jgi:ATP-dependent DNA helicase RecQ
MSTFEHQALDVLKHFWGYPNFRLKQSEVIQHILSQQDSVVLFPTGGGKSLCYQVPGLVMKGVCLVISPLISLMKDQVDELTQRNIAAAYFYSELASKERVSIWQKAEKGMLKFLFLSPEALKNSSIINQLNGLKINLIAIDEAHCISEWGHDFRPSYLNIAEALSQLTNKAPIVALTATATPKVLEEIVHKLQLRTPKHFISSFKRENLGYFLLPSSKKFEQIEKIILKNKGSGIIYCPSRNQCENTANWLQEKGFSAKAYHAGLATKYRTNIQQSWKKGETSIVVATNAFGMGVNKEDVRYVIHLESPTNCEAYFQEAGRAGRDNKKAFAILFLPVDIKEWYLNQKENILTPKFLSKVTSHLYQHLQIGYGEGEQQSFPLFYSNFGKKYKWSKSRIRKALLHLENIGFISTFQFPKSQISFRFVRIHFSPEEFDDQQEVLYKCYQYLLRKYTDKHFETITFDTEYLANHLFVHTSKVNKLMVQLEHLGLIKLYAKADLFIRFSMAREKNYERHLQFNKLEQINKNRINQLTSITSFMQNETICRTAWMMDYFGENSINYTCGVCDICVKNKKQVISESTILSIIQNSPISKKDLEKMFSISQLTDLNTLLDKMLLDEKIVYINHLFYLVSKEKS